MRESDVTRARKIALIFGRGPTSKKLTMRMKRSGDKVIRKRKSVDGKFVKSLEFESHYIPTELEREQVKLYLYKHF
jgi:hypothetical protein